MALGSYDRKTEKKIVRVVSEQQNTICAADDNDSDDDVYFSVVDTRKMAPVDDTINNSRMQMDNMEPYHKFSIHTDQQVHDNLREKHFALAKGYYQLVNEINHRKGRNSVQNSAVHTRLSRLFNFSSLIRTSFSLS
jgi:hypothetical protein